MKDGFKNVRWHLDLEHGVATPEKRASTSRLFGSATAYAGLHCHGAGRDGSTEHG